MAAKRPDGWTLEELESRKIGGAVKPLPEDTLRWLAAKHCPEESLFEGADGSKSGASADGADLRMLLRYLNGEKAAARGAEAASGGGGGKRAPVRTAASPGGGGGSGGSSPRAAATLVPAYVMDKTFFEYGLECLCKSLGLPSDGGKAALLERLCDEHHVTLGEMDSDSLVGLAGHFGIPTRGVKEEALMTAIAAALAGGGSDQEEEEEEEEEGREESESGEEEEEEEERTKSDRKEEEKEEKEDDDEVNEEEDAEEGDEPGLVKPTVGPRTGARCPGGFMRFGKLEPVELSDLWSDFRTAIHKALERKERGIKPVSGGVLYAFVPMDVPKLLEAGGPDWLARGVKVGHTVRWFPRREREHVACYGRILQVHETRGFRDDVTAEAIAFVILRHIGVNKHIMCPNKVVNHTSHEEWFVSRDKMSAEEWIETVKEVLNWVHRDAPGVLEPLLLDFGVSLV